MHRTNNHNIKTTDNALLCIFVDSASVLQILRDIRTCHYAVTGQRLGAREEIQQSCIFNKSYFFCGWEGHIRTLLEECESFIFPFHTGPNVSVMKIAMENNRHGGTPIYYVIIPLIKIQLVVIRE